MKTLKKILGGIVDFLMLVVIVFAIGVTLISLNSGNNNISKIGKYIPLNVKTNSMEPTIMKGDFIVADIHYPLSKARKNNNYSYLDKIISDFVEVNISFSHNAVNGIAYYNRHIQRSGYGNGCRNHRQYDLHTVFFQP